MSDALRPIAELSHRIPRESNALLHWEEFLSGLHPRGGLRSGFFLWGDRRSVPLRSLKFSQRFIRTAVERSFKYLDSQHPQSVRTSDIVGRPLDMKLH